ncbi:MAG TPA: hypothetical protein DHW42_11080 [Candidatus Marinimicrobia bacterium]|nr:hypothetical protein [Candidatus Neomarinimicrobiota bacterium]
MKTSSKILLITAIIILVFITALIVGSRFMLNNATAKFTEYSDEELIQKEYDFKDFNALIIAGIWSIDIEQGDQYSVKIQYPEIYEDEILITQESGELIFENDLKRRSGGGLIYAAITMPQLSAIEILEGADISFEEFNCDHLSIRSTGAAKIKGSGSSIQDLELFCDGAAHVNLRRSDVFNATVCLNGASRVELTMTGGKLSGSANGASSIIYYGEITSQDIKTAGAVSIRHR